MKLPAKPTVKQQSKAAANQSKSNSVANPVQLMRAGVVPKAPDNFRTTTKNLTVNASFDAIDGNKAFNKTQRTVVTDENERLSNDPFVKKISRPLQDDSDDSALLRPASAKNMAPEVDHIVPKKYNGSNDMRNARVLSKGNNTSSATTRPSNAQSGVAVYENVTVNNTAYNSGAILSDTDMNKAGTVYGKNSPSGIVNTLDTKDTGTVATDTQ